MSCIRINIDRRENIVAHFHHILWSHDLAVTFKILDRLQINFDNESVFDEFNNQDATAISFKITSF